MDVGFGFGFWFGLGLVPESDYDGMPDSNYDWCWIESRVRRCIAKSDPGWIWDLIRTRIRSPVQNPIPI